MTFFSSILKLFRRKPPPAAEQPFELPKGPFEWSPDWWYTPRQLASFCYQYGPAVGFTFAAKLVVALGLDLASGFGKSAFIGRIFC
jgi:hypothetical protein